MTTDDRLTPGFFLDVMDVLEHHGYQHHDKQHTGQAMAMIRDLAHIYEGTPSAHHGQAEPGRPVRHSGLAAGNEADQ